MIIIGINAYHADASAAIFVDGKLIAAIEEERFTRIKHWAGFPKRSIEFCLREAAIHWQDVDYYAIGRDPKAKMWNKLFYLAKNFGGSFSALKDRYANSRKVASTAEELSNASGLPVTVFNNKIKNVEHHRSHLASAFFCFSF